MEILVNLDVMMAKRKISAGGAGRRRHHPREPVHSQNNKAKAICFSTLMACRHELAASRATSGVCGRPTGGHRWKNNVKTNSRPRKRPTGRRRRSPRQSRRSSASREGSAVGVRDDVLAYVPPFRIGCRRLPPGLSPPGEFVPGHEARGKLSGRPGAMTIVLHVAQLCIRNQYDPGLMQVAQEYAIPRASPFRRHCISLPSTASVLLRTVDRRRAAYLAIRRN